MPPDILGRGKCNQTTDIPMKQLEYIFYTMRRTNAYAVALTSYKIRDIGK